MTGEIFAIYSASAAQAPMQSAPVATLEPGRGIVGDRYYASAGSFSGKLEQKGLADWHVTLIETEEIDKFNQSEGLELNYGEFRRNIATRGIDLNDLVGKTFRVGNAVLEGMRLCEPCATLAALISDRVLPAMVGRAGLRARVIEGGTIAPGDNIEALVR